MIFLIEYDTSEGNLVKLRQFPEMGRKEAEDSRLALELDLRRSGVDHEVVLLEAASEEALRITHRRYFEDLRQMLQGLDGTAAA